MLNNIDRYLVAEARGKRRASMRLSHPGRLYSLEPYSNRMDSKQQTTTSRSLRFVNRRMRRYLDWPSFVIGGLASMDTADYGLASLQEHFNRAHRGKPGGGTCC